MVKTEETVGGLHVAGLKNQDKQLNKLKPDTSFAFSHSY